MDNCRRAALEVLLDVEKKQAFSNLSLNSNIKKFGVSDGAFTRELVYGVLRNKYLLDYYLKGFIKRGFDRLKPVDLTLLRLGAYQALYMDSVPDYAACSETVELAVKYARGREGFINGVLRSLVRSRDKLPEISFDDPIKEMSVRYSCNEWIVRLLAESCGIEYTRDFLMESLKTPELILRVNVLKTSREELIGELTSLGFRAEKSDLSTRAVRAAGSGLLKTDAFIKGLFSVQDTASIMAADMLSPAPGMRVVDVCAAPGGKTAAIAELMDNRGEILAADIYPAKLELIKETAARNGIGIIRTTAWDSRVFNPEWEGKMDRVLADVPCSGIGVIRRKPEIKYKEEFDIKALIDDQKKILMNASRYLKPGGLMVYSTCTVNPAENRGVTAAFLKENPEYKTESEKFLSPMRGTDGFYICRILREA